MNVNHFRAFWRDATAIRESVTPHVAWNVLGFGVFAAAICLAAALVDAHFEASLALEVAPYEIAGAALGLLLVMRTNAGYDRWWEARKLWGGIVNQSRNLAIGALSYGPRDDAWRTEFIGWAAAFPHVARSSLRGERPPPEVEALVGRECWGRIAESDHMPSYVAMRLGLLLRDACEDSRMDRFAFLAVDRERAQLIDHIGACERILKTPLPRVYAIKIRRFITLFLMTVPLILLHRVGQTWLVPLITMLVAYPLLALDQIGIELQNPFIRSNLSHLPLDDIAATIERNLKGIHKECRTGCGAR